MQKFFTEKAKKAIGIAALTCFLSIPVSCTLSTSTASASPFDKQDKIEQRHDRWDKDNNDKHSPMRNDKNDKKRQNSSTAS